MNRRKINRTIRERVDSITEFAKEMGVERSTIYNKMNGKYNWTLRDRYKMRFILGLTEKEERELFDEK